MTGVPPPVEFTLLALGDPMRRRLLESLAASGEASASSLASCLPISRQGVVKHLRVLDQAGLVNHSRSGKEVRYRVRPEGVRETARWLEGIALDWDRRLAGLKRRAENGPVPAALEQ